MSRLLPGDLVEVLPAGEIFATLDKHGVLDGLPFMPEMLRYCGRRYQVWRRVEKTCVEGDRVRRLKSVVFLDDLRCAGDAHDGCEKECRLFWHTAWLRSLGRAGATGMSAPNSDEALPAVAPPEFPYATQVSEKRYFCQSTELARATHPMSRLDLRQYYRDWRFKTYRAGKLLTLLAVPLWVRLQVLFRGISAVWLRGNLTRTPNEPLNLEPGEWVEVKSRQQISRTLDHDGRNRGLVFSPHMLPSCGLQFRVRRRVRRIILERTGEMKQIGNTVTLMNCTCDGHVKWGGCPRDAHHLWREVWLRRVPGNDKHLQSPGSARGSMETE